MSTLDFDALEATARAQAAAYSKMLELDGGVGLLGIRHPDMFEDMMAWNGSSENEHADTTLALIARIREAEEAADGEAAAHNDTISAWREAEDKLREAEATIDEVEDFVTRHYLDTTMGERVLGILTRHQDKREGE